MIRRELMGLRYDLAAAIAGTVLATAGCGNQTTTPAPGNPGGGGGGGACLLSSDDTGKTGAVVAHVGDQVITADEVKARLGEQAPFLRARYSNPQQKKEFLENMIKFEILSKQALEKGLGKTSETQNQIRRMLVQELIKNFYDQKTDVSDEDLKKYYDKHIDEYVKPEKVRVQHIFLAAAEGDAKGRSAAKAKATKILGEIKANIAKLEKDKTPPPAAAPLAFMSDMAKTESMDPATKAAGGTVNFMSVDDLTKTYSPEFAKAALALTATASLSGVIETPKGFHIARLLGRQAAMDQAFDDKLKPQLKERQQAESRSTRFDEYYQNLRKSMNVTIDDAALAAVEIPNTPAKGGAPGAPGGTPGAPGIAPSPHPMPPGMNAPGAPGAPGMHPPMMGGPGGRPMMGGHPMMPMPHPAPAAGQPAPVPAPH